MFNLLRSLFSSTMAVTLLGRYTYSLLRYNKIYLNTKPFLKISDPVTKLPRI